jgi:uncharacterized membrane protein
MAEHLMSLPAPLFAPLSVSLSVPLAPPDVLANLPPAPVFPVFAPFRVFAPVSVELAHPEMARLAAPATPPLHLPPASAVSVDFPLDNAGVPSLEALLTSARPDAAKRAGKSPAPARLAIAVPAARPAATPAAVSTEAVRGQFAAARPSPQAIARDAGKWSEQTHTAVVIASVAMVWWMFYGGWTEAARTSLFGTFSAFWPLKLAAFVLAANFARRAGLALALRLMLAHVPHPLREGRVGAEASLVARLQQVLAQLGGQGNQSEPAELRRQVESINRDLREEILALAASLKESPAQLSARLRVVADTIAREASVKPPVRAGRPGFGHM